LGGAACHGDLLATPKPLAKAGPGDLLATPKPLAKAGHGEVADEAGSRVATAAARCGLIKSTFDRSSAFLRCRECFHSGKRMAMSDTPGGYTGDDGQTDSGRKVLKKII